MAEHPDVVRKDGPLLRWDDTLGQYRVVRAADIPDAAILDLLTETSWVPVYDILATFSEWPPKVVRAKLESLERRQLAHGCAMCACTGWSLGGWPAPR